MKKIGKALGWAIVIILVTALIYASVIAPPVMTGMAAKTVCSCVYVTGRTFESVKKEELQVFPMLSSLDIELLPDSSVTATLLWNTSKAIYRKGLGCTLLAEQTEEAVRNQKINIAGAPPFNQDTVAWPAGNKIIPTDQGVNQELLTKAIEDAFADKDPENPIFTHAVVVVYNGEIIGEKYAPGFDINTRMMGWSMTKSITNALIGILVKDEKLRVNDAAPIEEWQNDDRKSIRIENLLQATTGLKWNEGYFNPMADFHTMFIRKDDKASFAASRKSEYPPGERFEYSSGATNILSRIIRQSVGDEMYYRFPYERLFYKTGMHTAIIETDASGTFVASSYAYASARDWARFGLLYLNDGMFGTERILPEGWVEYSTTPSRAAKLQEYGAQIWINKGEPENPSNCYFKGLPNEAIVFDGFEENSVVIIPSKNLVVVRLGVTHNANFSLANLVNGVIAALPEK